VKKWQANAGPLLFLSLSREGAHAAGKMDAAAFFDVVYVVGLFRRGHVPDCQQGSHHNQTDRSAALPDRVFTNQNVVVGPRKARSSLSSTNNDTAPLLQSFDDWRRTSAQCQKI
jgi:hypothetical protein